MTGHKLFQEMKMTAAAFFGEKNDRAKTFLGGLKFPISPYVGR